MDNLEQVFFDMGQTVKEQAVLMVNEKGQKQYYVSRNTVWQILHNGLEKLKNDNPEMR